MRLKLWSMPKRSIGACFRQKTAMDSVFWGGQVLLEVPGELGITAVDAKKHEDVGPLAEGRSELIQLGLWLMAERKKVAPPPPGGPPTIGQC